MKHLLLGMMVMGTLVSCNNNAGRMKTPVTNINTKVEASIKAMTHRSGYRCLFRGATDPKEIFLEEVTGDAGEKRFSPHDYNGENTIVIFEASIEGFKLMPFSVKPVSDEDKSKMQGTVMLFPQEKSDESTAIYSGKITFTSMNPLEGVLEQSTLIVEEGKSHSTPFEEVAKIEDCRRELAIIK